MIVRRSVPSWLVGVGLLVVATAVAFAFVWQPIQRHNLQIQNLIYVRGLVDDEIEEYHRAHGTYARSLETVLREMAKDPQLRNRFTKLDAWGHPMLYRSDGRQFLLVSFGRDGLPDGSDYVAMRTAGKADNSPCGNPDADIIFSDRGELRTCGK